MKVTIEITEQEIKDLKLIRNYFGEHDVTMLEHLAYNELDKLVKKLTMPNVVGRGEQLADYLQNVIGKRYGIYFEQQDIDGLTELG